MPQQTECMCRYFVFLLSQYKACKQFLNRCVTPLGDDTLGNFLSNVAVQCYHKWATRWDTEHTTDLKYPNRNFLPILNGKVPKTRCSKKIPHVSSPSGIWMDRSNVVKLPLSSFVLVNQHNTWILCQRMLMSMRCLY